MCNLNGKSNLSRRVGVTLIELLIVVAIVGVLLTLLLAAVQRVREAAARAQSMNNLRQVAIAANNFAAAHDSHLPNVAGDPGSVNPGQSVLVALLPYVGENNLYQRYVSRLGGIFVPVNIYVSPADPTIGNLRARTWMAASYAANAQVFTDSPSLSTTFVDGTSNTILFGEHYALCNAAVFSYAIAEPLHSAHRPTFADGGPRVEQHANCGDDYPVTSGSPPMSKAAYGYGWTFQVAPNPNLPRQVDGQLDQPPMPKGCAEDLANTPHHSGMVTAWGDGSVRILAGGVAPNVYWGAVTPAGGEILNFDW